MAEGGYDPFSFGKEDNPDDFDDDTDLRLGRKPSETPVRITSTSYQNPAYVVNMKSKMKTTFIRK